MRPGIGGARAADNLQSREKSAPATGGGGVVGGGCISRGCGTSMPSGGGGGGGWGVCSTGSSRKVLG